MMPISPHLHPNQFLGPCAYWKTYFLYDISEIKGLGTLMSSLGENYIRLVPDTLNNYRYYFALLSIEHFFAL